MTTQDKPANDTSYDHADAAYLFLSFTGIYGDRCDMLEELTEGLSGQYGVYEALWDLAIETAREFTNIIDFADGSLGMFAYEHLNDISEGSLPYKVFTLCLEESHKPADVVRAYATDSGWPLVGVQSISRTEHDKKPDSIQVVKTIQEGDDVEACAVDSTHATHWSVYVRGKDGLADWYADYTLTDPKAGEQVLQKAAALSARFNVPIEPIR